MKTALMVQMSAAGPNIDPAARLLDFIEQRVPQIEGEMLDWVNKLAIYEDQADNRFEARRTDEEANEDRSIFDLNNSSLNIVRGVARYMKGRCEGDIFGGSPWFFAKAEGLQNQELATGMQKHLDWKFRMANDGRGARQIGKEAIGYAIDLGTAVVKTTWKITAEPFERLADVFHGPDGQPVVHPNPNDPSTGDYVEDGHPNLVAGADSALYQPPNDQTTNQVPPAVMGTMAQGLITEPNIKATGLNVEVIPFRNLLAPMKIAHLEDADLVGHKYDIPFLDLAAHYDPTGQDKDMQAALANLRKWNSESATGDRRAKADENGSNDSAVAVDADLLNPWLTIHELRIKFDPFGRGNRRLFVVVHLESRTILYADYMGNMTPGGDLDMHAITINRRPGRWYGRGYYEVYEQVQRNIDELNNSIIVHNQHSADPVICINRGVVEEIDAKNGDIDRYPGKTFFRSAQSNPELKAFEILELPDLSAGTEKLRDLFIQVLQQDSGVTAAQQGDPGALPNTSTATGTNAILSTGSTMHQLVIDDLKEGLEPQLTFSVKLIYSRQDKDETFSYMHNDQSVQGMLALSDAEQLRQLYMAVTFTLTRIKNQELRDSASLLIDKQLQYIGLVPQAQMIVRRGFIVFAQSLDFDDCESLFPLPTMPGVPPGAALPGQPGAELPPPAAPDSGEPDAAASAPDPTAAPAPAAGPLLPNVATVGVGPTPMAAAPPLNTIPVNVQPASPI